MALINCPECGKEVSDKVTNCIHCGCPIEINNSEIESTNNTVDEKQHKKKSKVGICVLIISLLIVITIAIVFFINTRSNKYEEYALNCIQEMNYSLKNPDSLIIKDVTFYQGINDDVQGETKETLKPLEKLSRGYPYVVIKYTAQNGFGGNTFGYIYFTISSDEKKFVSFGSCNTLDINEVDKEDYGACKMINILQDNFKTVGNVNLKRINKQIKK